MFISLVVFASVVYAFIDGGSPRAARDNKYDTTRLSDMQNIKNWINTFYNKNKRLPSSIYEASADYSSYNQSASMKDPESKTEYEYTLLNDKDYKLCATFATDTTKNTSDYNKQFAHPIGYFCFQLSADKY